MPKIVSVETLKKQENDFKRFSQYRGKSRHGFIFSACKEARFCWQLFSAGLMSYLHAESYYLEM
jgi:hypothetical protein